MKRLGTSLLVLSLVGVGTAKAQFGGVQFGGPLAVSSDQAFAGEAGQSNLPGVVYVYEGTNGEWREVAQLKVGDAMGPPDGFGRAIAAQDRLMIIGAPLTNDGAGTVYGFRADENGNWSLSGSFAAGTPTEGAGFGSRVMIHGDVALVSAPGDGSGAVHVFRRNADGWAEEGTLRPTDESVRRFGSALAIDGDIILASAPEGRRPPATPATVEAFQYDRTSSSWTSLGAIDADGLGERSSYGSSLALRDGNAYVGAPGVMGSVGAVYVFHYDLDASEWAVQTRLAPFDARPNTRFGTSIAFDDAMTLIGAPGDNNRLGAFYAFGKDASGNWANAQKMTSGILEGRAAFASTVAIGENVAIIGASGVDGSAGAAVIFERNAAGMWDERNMVVNERRGFAAVTGGEVVCEDDKAANFACGDVNIVSFLPIKDIGGGRGTSVNDIWGWTDPQTGSEYAIVGRTDGTSFVDITDPYSPNYLGDLPMTTGSRTSIWRDMKVYQDHVYIVADNALEHGMQVFDLTQLRTLRNVPVTFNETFRYTGINSAHNIVINEETGFGYAVGSSGGGETCGGGLHMINLENPARPTFAGCFADATTGRRLTGYSHDAQCVVYHGPDTEHDGKEICMGSNETALSISDVTDKANPVPLSMITYPNVAYAHQGWFSEDQRYFYMNDEGDEPQGLVEGTRTLVWDVVDLDDPVLVKEYIAETTTTDHNLYIRGDLMYQSNYGSGLRVIDISNRENPVEVGFFDTTPYGGMGSWSNYPYFPSGVIVATSGGEGLFVLKATRQPRLTP